MDNQTPPDNQTPQENQPPLEKQTSPVTPPPTPEEEWAKTLKLDYDPEKITEAPQAPEPIQPHNGNTPPPPFPGPQYSPLQQESEPMPPTYMVWSILALICCCFIPAIVAIIYSAQVSSKYYAKDYEGARKCSERAQIWIIVSIVLGIIGMALYLPLTLLSPS